MAQVARSHVAAVRQFNRLYTRRIGVLDAGHLGSDFSLTEVRVLYELAHRSRATAGSLAHDLELDEGYLSRILRRFEQLGLLRREASATDRRTQHLLLTAKGIATFRPLDRRAEGAIDQMLSRVPRESRAAIVAAMARIGQALEPDNKPTRRVILRTHRTGDMGWILHRHGVLYAREYGYDQRFEAIVAKVAGDFLENFDVRKERCWVAERDGEILGSVMLVKKSASTAKLRLLYLEPHARGLGLGRRLVDECIRFARGAGYRKVTLWTQSSLTAARHIYETAGFRMLSSTMHADFGPLEAAEIWELSVSP